MTFLYYLSNSLQFGRRDLKLVAFLVIYNFDIYFFWWKRVPRQGFQAILQKKLQQNWVWIGEQRLKDNKTKELKALLTFLHTFQFFHFPSGACFFSLNLNSSPCEWCFGSCEWCFGSCSCSVNLLLRKHVCLGNQFWFEQNCRKNKDWRSLYKN